MSTLWKKLLIAASTLLVAALVLSGVLWQRVGVLEGQLTYTLQGWKDAQDRLEKGVWEGKWLVENYPKLSRELSLRLGIGEDARLFITPDDPAVADIVREITSSPSAAANEKEWADTERMYSWLVRNIEYAVDSYTPVLPEPPDGELSWQGGFWKKPAETLKDKAGDCEDMTALLVSMLLHQNGRKHPVWGIGIESSKPPARHIAIAIPVVNNQLTILDPTARFHTTFPNGWGIAAKETKTAIEEWLARWQDKMSDAWVYMVFSEDIYLEFKSTAEFYSWLDSLKF